MDEELLIEETGLETTQTESHVEVEETGVLGTLGISAPIFIAQLVNFLIVLVVLWKFAYKPIVERLDKRSEEIERGLKNAEDAEKRLNAVADEREKVIAAAKSEATQILEVSRAEAEEQKKDLVAKAKQEVERVVTQGKTQLQSEKESMLREAKKDIVEIAIAAATKILAESVDEKKSKELAEHVVKKMT